MGLKNYVIGIQVNLEKHQSQLIALLMSLILWENMKIYKPFLPFPVTEGSNVLMIWLTYPMVTLYCMKITRSLWTGASTGWHRLKSITWQNHLYNWLTWIYRLKYQKYQWTCLWSHLWTYLMLEIRRLIHNQFKARLVPYRIRLYVLRRVSSRARNASKYIWDYLCWFDSPVISLL